MTDTRHPDEILGDLDGIAIGHRGITRDYLRSLLHEVIADVLDSVRLAMSTPDSPDAGTPTYVEPERRQAILTTVTDYVVNNYGDD